MPHAVKAKWLLDLCKDCVKRFVFDSDEIDTLVQQTSELEEAHRQTGWKCRAPDCHANFAYHSGRVR